MLTQKEVTAIAKNFGMAWQESIEEERHGVTASAYFFRELLVTNTVETQGETKTAVKIFDHTFRKFRNG